MRKEILANECIYHVYNRGVEKRRIFMDDKDYLRFIHDLFEFNDVKCAPASNIRFALRQPADVTAEGLSQCLVTPLPNIDKKRREPRKLLAEILAFCLMPNHFHLILRQLRDDGIANFMQKLGVGYVKYFNRRYERVGSLFQGPFKAIGVENESYFYQLSRYIHLNPIGLIEPKWKENGIGDRKKAEQFLEGYRWSSYLDYIGKKNFSSLTSRDFLLGLFNRDQSEYKKFVQKWAAEDLGSIEELILE